MEMELLPPFETMQLPLPEKKIKRHWGFFFSSALCLLYKLLGFRNSIEKIHNAGFRSSSDIWGLQEDEEFILEFCVSVASSKDK